MSSTPLAKWAEGIAKVVSDHVLEKSHGYPPVAIGLFGIYNITNDVSTRIHSRLQRGPPNFAFGAEGNVSYKEL